MAAVVAMSYSLFAQPPDTLPYRSISPGSNTPCSSIHVQFLQRKHIGPLASPTGTLRVLGATVRAALYLLVCLTGSARVEQLSAQA